MPVRVERRDRVLTVIHSRPAARNAVDPAHGQALYEAFVAFAPVSLIGRRRCYCRDPTAINSASVVTPPHRRHKSMSRISRRDTALQGSVA